MKRVLATAGILGLAMLGSTAPAIAGPGPADKITICHATGSEKNPHVEITVSENALNGHGRGQAVHEHDIIPAAAGGCVVEEPETPETPPVTPPVTPPGKTPEVTPPAVTPGVTPSVETPAVKAPAVVPAGAAAAAPKVVNRGFNAQTAVGNQADGQVPGWLGGLAALVAATAAVALRQRGRRQDSPAVN
ncbi:hypothetical protein [Arthrobacter sp. ISL-30]|uniref:hypothetical protein n=1 Tax=Arthrobacter sp. ISL-30 TaxID=2819109 RepID=UPI001BEB0DCB|nr:hypothetical protein [Arthrobacter sp. ISL-30]MBT2512642.1 hypothetical protein [Arthrobacter sp. ISL-30]